MLSISKLTICQGWTLRDTTTEGERSRSRSRSSSCPTGSAEPSTNATTLANAPSQHSRVLLARRQRSRLRDSKHDRRRADGVQQSDLRDRGPRKNHRADNREGRDDDEAVWAFRAIVVAHELEQLDPRRHDKRDTDNDPDRSNARRRQGPSLVRKLLSRAIRCAMGVQGVECLTP